MKKAEEYKEALLDMVCQFACHCQDKQRGLPAFTSGGLSALEHAFDVLGWDDPMPCPENKCFLCNEWATCGTPMPKNYTINYARLCGNCYGKIQKEFEKAKKE